MVRRRFKRTRYSTIHQRSKYLNGKIYAPAGLLGVVLPVRGPLDVIQFETRTTIGEGNRAEFGDVTTPDGFDAVFAWSPYENVDPNKNG